MLPLTTCFAALCRYRSLLERWLIQERIKFLVKSMGKSDAETRDSAFWKIWNPQYFRWEEDVDENNDSAGLERNHGGIRELPCDHLGVTLPSTRIRNSSGKEPFDDSVNTSDSKASHTKWTWGFQEPDLDFTSASASSSMSTSYHLAQLVSLIIGRGAWMHTLRILESAV